MELTENEKWVHRDEKVVAPAQRLSYFPLVIDKAEGSILTDADGKEYIDFLSSAASLNLGSGHPAVTKAIEEQLKRCAQYTAVYTCNKPMIEYAERLVSVFPGGVPAKVSFSNCGSEANDAAIKFSRAYTGRSKIITFLNAYHGNTYGASSLSSCALKMHEKIGPLLPEIYRFPFVGAGNEAAAHGGSFVAPIEEAFATYLNPHEVAAVIIEPLQGDGGMLPAHPVFMQQLYALCKKYGILFISEEVQQGFFRTGKFFGIEYYDVQPDGIVMGKSIGAGLPLGAFMARTEIIDALPAPAHIFTLAGNHLSCAAGKASFDVLTSDAFQTQLKASTALLDELLERTVQKHPRIGYSRGLGFSRGLAVVDPETGAQDLDGAYKICYRSYENGLLVLTVMGNILRIQPPLTIPAEQLKQGFAILDAAISDLEAGRIPDEVLVNRHGW